MGTGITTYSNSPCLFWDLGMISVPEAESLMARLADQRFKNHIPDVVLVLWHPPTVALGLKDREGSLSKHLRVSVEVLQAHGIALTYSVRGGGITYHWPGQVVCYPVLALDPNERNIPRYMRKLEEVGLKTLRRFGIDARRRRDAAAYLGLWIDEKKIASMGVRVQRWITGFGFALNVFGDHAPSRWIHPCGLAGVELVTMEEILESRPSREEVIQELGKNFSQVFRRSFTTYHSRQDWFAVTGSSGGC